jgi:oligoribonuclease (3'-5' exoribonuclease)
MVKYERSGWFAFDTETGGLDSNNNSLLTLSGIVVDDDLQPLATPINLKIKHDIYHVSAKAMEVNKINLLEHDKIAQPIDEAGFALYRYLKPFVDNKRLGIIGQNVEGHDKAFIEKSGLLKNWGRFFNRDVLDTKRFADNLKFCGIIPQENGTRLVDLAEFFGISSAGAHDAEVDLWMTLQVLDELRKLTLKGKVKKKTCKKK